MRGNIPHYVLEKLLVSGKNRRKSSLYECIFDSRKQRRTPSDCFFLEILLLMRSEWCDLKNVSWDLLDSTKTFYSWSKNRRHEKKTTLSSTMPHCRRNIVSLACTWNVLS